MVLIIATVCSVVVGIILVFVVVSCIMKRKAKTKNDIVIDSNNNKSDGSKFELDMGDFSFGDLYKGNTAIDQLEYIGDVRNTE